MNAVFLRGLSNVGLSYFKPRIELSAMLECHRFLQTGFNPAYYRLCQQIKNARLLLCEPTVPLSDVALTCGFYDQSHFTHAFRRFAAETPAHYRQRKLSQFYNIKKC